MRDTKQLQVTHAQERKRREREREREGKKKVENTLMHTHTPNKTQQMADPNRIIKE
jgi:hypothetical protein